MTDDPVLLLVVFVSGALSWPLVTAGLEIMSRRVKRRRDRHRGSLADI